ncbi:MAG TPA: cell wall-binding repeat-containing protein, partial [Acidothermaceae bacterium]
PAVAADPAATPLQGADRYATAVAVANAIFTAPTSVGLASGVTFPDALSGGAYQAHAGGPILLTAPATLPSSTATYLTGAKTTITNAEIFGGDTALSASVQSAITAALGG